MSADPKHPMQPIVFVGDVARFKENKIVRFLVNEYGMNKLCRTFPDAFTEGPDGPSDFDDDWTQLAQLIGDSVSRAGDLSYFDREVLEKADAELERIMKSELTPEDTQELPGFTPPHVESGTARLKSIAQLTGENEGGVVFPFKYEMQQLPVGDLGAGMKAEIVVPGMTYRQWLIGKALNGDFSVAGLRAQGMPHDISDETIDKRVTVYERFADRIIARQQKREAATQGQ